MGEERKKPIRNTEILRRLIKVRGKINDAEIIKELDYIIQNI